MDTQANVASVAPPELVGGTASPAAQPTASPRRAGPDWPPEVPPLELFYRLSVDQYHAMIQTGILGEDETVELIHGWLIRKMSKNRPHIASTRRAAMQLRGHLPDGYFVDSQEPIATEHSEPEPDVVVLRGRVDDYDDRLPRGADLALVVEIADSSLTGDRTWKLGIYAREGIAAYWIINLVAWVVEVYGDPDVEGARYRTSATFRRGDSIPLVIEGREIARIPVDSLIVVS